MKIRPIDLDKPMCPKETTEALEQYVSLLRSISARRGKIPFSDKSKLRKASAMSLKFKDQKVGSFY